MFRPSPEPKSAGRKFQQMLKPVEPAGIARYRNQIKINFTMVPPVRACEHHFSGVFIINTAD